MPMKSAKEEFIILCNVAGALHNPKGITVHSHCPNGDENDVLCWLSGLIGICQYPFDKSIVEKIVDPESWPKIKSI